jgi:hypothetical protein
MLSVNIPGHASYHAELDFKRRGKCNVEGEPALWRAMVRAEVRRMRNKVDILHGTFYAFASDLESALAVTLDITLDLSTARASLLPAAVTLSAATTALAPSFSAAASAPASMMPMSVASE